MMILKRFLPVLLWPLLILLIPAGAMALSVEGWAWGPGDFLIAWVVMAGVGLAYRVVTQKAVNRTYRIATAIGLAAGFLLLWVNGAVGLIGGEDNPANLMYGGVLVVGLVGAMIARLTPRGLSQTAFATAAAQFVVPVIAVAVLPDNFSPAIVPVFVLNFGFVLMFAASGWLFRRAAVQQALSNGFSGPGEPESL